MYGIVWHETQLCIMCVVLWARCAPHLADHMLFPGLLFFLVPRSGGVACLCPRGVAQASVHHLRRLNGSCEKNLRQCNMAMP